MDLDKKVSALKILQGHIWRKAYECGKIKGHLFPDVAPALRMLKEAGKTICIYSSGSVEAQKLLFRFSDAGDLTPLISKHFDTNIGLKVENRSYESISKEIGKKSSEILFLTDVEREAFPCVECGMKCVLVVRDGNAPLTDEAKSRFDTISSFEELC